MISGIKIPKILFIKGVFKKDCCSDDLLEKKVLESVSHSFSEGIIINDILSSDNVSYSDTPLYYDKLPTIFESLDTWPKKTNLLCWYCTLSFDTVPIFIPKVIEPISKKTESSDSKFTFSVHGVFCSFGCACQYTKITNYNIVEQIEILSKLKLLHKHLCNKKMVEYVSYPNIYQMKQYGGDLTTDQFKELIKKFRNDNANELIDQF
jgi:hypothetical protein